MPKSAALDGDERFCFSFLPNLRRQIMTTKVEHKHDPRILAIHKLRVNLQSLVAESRIIRREERRAGIVYRCELHTHRVTTVREETRYTHLALGFVRGRSYQQIERNAHKAPELKRLLRKINDKGATYWGYGIYKVSEDVVKQWLVEQ